jgi:hypothetical protein
MPWHFEVDRLRRVVQVRVHGTLCDQDLLDGDEALRNHPEFQPDFDQLIDMREAVGAKVTTDGIRALAHKPPLFSPESRRAIVVLTDLGFGMARMFELLREGKSGEIRVFRDLAEANDWLDRH